MSGHKPALALVPLLALTAWAPAAEPPAPTPTPTPTPKKPVTDTYHGVKVTDDYRRLEKADDPAVRAWTEAQNKATRAFLDKVPALTPLRKRLEELMTDPAPSYSAIQVRPHLLFALKKQPPREQPFLVVLGS